MYPFVKRGLDTVLALIGLIVVSPFLLLISLSILFSMGWPV